MQRLADFADGEEGARSRLLDFQGLLAAALNEANQPVQDRQRRLRRFAFGRLQGLDDLGGFLRIRHAQAYSAASALASSTSSTFGGDIGRL